MNLNDFKNETNKSVFGMTKTEAHQKNICLKCKKKPHFYSEAGRKEYQISGICEPCFDAMFKTED